MRGLALVASASGGQRIRRRGLKIALLASPRASSSRPLLVRFNDPILETIARSIYSLFPRCRECGQAIERFEDADVRILTQRVVHRGGCPSQPSPETNG